MHVQCTVKMSKNVVLNGWIYEIMMMKKKINMRESTPIFGSMYLSVSRRLRLSFDLFNRPGPMV